MTTKAPSKQITPTARVVDWEGIERDYRAGMLSVREIALAFGVSNTGIHKRVDKYGWSRDLQAKINQAADELVNKALMPKIPTVKQLAVLSRTPEQVSLNGSIVQRTVEIAANRAANVRLSQCQDIARMRVLTVALIAEVEELSNSDSADRPSTATRIDSTKKLSDTLKNVIAMEREAYGMDKAEDPGANLNPLAALLASMRRSALPVVHQSALPDGLVDDDE